MTITEDGLVRKYANKALEGVTPLADVRAVAEALTHGREIITLPPHKRVRNEQGELDRTGELCPKPEGEQQLNQYVCHTCGWRGAAPEE